MRGNYINRGMRNKRGNAVTRKDERPGTLKKKPECLMKVQERQTKQENKVTKKEKRRRYGTCVAQQFVNYRE
jgi:hypothetical protein